MNAEKPARGISELFEHKDSVCYRIDCECTSEDHAVTTWIEVQRSFDDCEYISVRFYVNTYSSPYARDFFSV